MRAKRRLAGAALQAELPEDALSAGARVTLIARGSVLVEGQQGVVELSQSCIRMRTKQGVVSVCGGALCLRRLSPDAALITGDPISTVTYDKPGNGA